MFKLCWWASGVCDNHFICFCLCEFVCLWICMFVYFLICTFVHLCICVSAYLLIFIFVCLCASIFVYWCACVLVYLCVFVYWCAHVLVYLCIFVCVCVCACAAVWGVGRRAEAGESVRILKNTRELLFSRALSTELLSCPPSLSLSFLLTFSLIASNSSSKLLATCVCVPTIYYVQWDLWKNKTSSQSSEMAISKSETMNDSLTHWPTEG